jgi:DNA-binding NarL/FixJ family response regulator
MIRALVVDDQELVRDGIRTVLDVEDDIEVIGEAGDGARAVRLCRSLDPDIVLMDIRMTGMDGLQALRLILDDKSTLKPKVLMLTTFDLDEYLFDALRAGASGFLLKDVPRRRLVDAVRSIAAGDSLLDPRLTRRLIEHFVNTPPIHTPLPAMAHLTAREQDVFQLLGRGMSNAEIAAKLYLSESTVKSYVANLFGKLELHDRAQAVVLAYESGFIVPNQPRDP